MQNFNFKLNDQELNFLNIVTDDKIISKILPNILKQKNNLDKKISGKKNLFIIINNCW